MLDCRVAPTKKTEILREILEKDARKKIKTIVFSNKAGRLYFENGLYLEYAQIRTKIKIFGPFMQNMSDFWNRGGTYFC